MDDPGDTQFLVLLIALLKPFTLEAALGIASISVLLFLSALMSGSEVAFFSLSLLDKEALQDEQNRTSKAILSLLDKPKRLLATILVGNNFVNVGIVILSTFITSSLFDFSEFPRTGLVFQIGIITFIILLVGEVIPKVYANRNALLLAKYTVFPLQVMDVLFSPITYLMVNATNIIDKRFKERTNNNSVDELSLALELTTKSEDTTSDEKRILQGIVKFGNIEVKQIMTSRMDIHAIEDETNFADLIHYIKENGYSRMPVYNESLDKITGIIHIKDLLQHMDDETFDWKSLMRKPFFVPEMKKIDDLLKEFQHKKMHMAIVVDEFGGTSGIITLEDILEEIVGEISDEFDDEDIFYSKIDENVYVFEAKTQLNDFCRIVGIEETVFDEDRGDAETLAGFILEQAGKIPKNREKITYRNFDFVIEAADKRRIKRIKVTINPEAQDEE